MCIVLFYVAIIILVFYVVNRLTCATAKSPVCLVGKTAIVTGGNSGIGFQVAQILASRGCRVIIADIADAEKSKQKIIEETGNPNILVKHVDLSSFKSVRELAKDINETEPRLDILVNNAGVGVASKLLTDDGLNTVMQINHFGPFLLTHLLTDLLKKSAPSRIVFTSSYTAFVDNLSVKTINRTDYKVTEMFMPNFVYGNSKLCVLISSNGFAERLKGTGVTCNAVHPGLIATGLVKNASQIGERWFTYRMLNLNTTIMGKSIWEGAQTTVYAAIDKEFVQTTGKFLADCRNHFMPPKASNKQFCQMIWEESERLVHLTEGEKLKKTS